MGKKSVIQGSIHYYTNPGGGIAPKSCVPAALKQQMKNKKKTQQNEQNTRRRKVSMAISDNTQELEDPPASFKSAVWEHFGFCNIFKTFFLQLDETFLFDISHYR